MAQSPPEALMGANRKRISSLKEGYTEFGRVCGPAFTVRFLGLSASNRELEGWGLRPIN